MSADRRAVGRQLINEYQETLSILDEHDSHETRRRVNGKIRTLVGTVDPDLLDEIEYEDEIENFEPLRPRRSRR